MARGNGSTSSNKRMGDMVNKVNDKGRKVTYEGGYDAPGMHNAASKTVTRNADKWGNPVKGKRKGVTKTLSVTGDTPYHGRPTGPATVAGDRETLTRTKEVDKGYGPHGGQTKNVKKKAITKKRAERIKKRIRKHDAAETSSKSYYENR